MLLREEREKIIETALKAKAEKLVPLTFGNFSLRDGKTGLVCVTPSGMPYETLVPSDIVVTDLDGRIADGERRPSIETPLHLEIYKRRDDVFGIVHTHSTFCTAWACVRRPLKCITSEAAALVGGDIRRAEFAPPGSALLAEVTAEALKNDMAVLMANHGVVCVGKDIDKAFANALIVEESAKVAFLAERLGEVETFEDSMMTFLKEDTENNYGQR